MPEIVAIKQVHGTEPKYKKTFDERVTKSYAEHFHNGSKKFAFKTILENYIPFVNFSDRMVMDHQNRKMYTLPIDE